MDLFGLVEMEDPKSVAVGVRPLRDGEDPILEATRKRVTELVIPEPEGSPARAVPIQQVPPPQPVATEAQPTPTVAQPSPLSENIIRVDSDESEEEVVQLKRRRAADGNSDGAESSKRPRSETESVAFSLG